MLAEILGFIFIIGLCTIPALVVGYILKRETK